MSSSTLQATIQLPERFVSTHPKDSAVLPAVWNVTAGAYGLGLNARTATNVTVNVSSHPGTDGETLHLRIGDVVATTVSLPSSVTPGRLPGPTAEAGITTSWTSVRTETGWDVTITETVTAPIATTPETYRADPGDLESTSVDVRFHHERAHDPP